MIILTPGSLWGTKGRSISDYNKRIIQIFAIQLTALCVKMLKLLNSFLTSFYCFSLSFLFKGPIIFLKYKRVPIIFITWKVRGRFQKYTPSQSLSKDIINDGVYSLIAMHRKCKTPFVFDRTFLYWSSYSIFFFTNIILVQKKIILLELLEMFTLS